MVSERDITTRQTLIPAIPLARFRLTLEATIDVELPINPGDLLHSRFGATLRRLFCSTRQPACDGCLLITGCPYSYLFNTPITESSHPLLRHGGQAPHPFVFQLAPGHPMIKQGDNLDMPLVLIGRGVEYMPHILHTFESMTVAPGRGRRAQQGWPWRLQKAAQYMADGRWQGIYPTGRGQQQESVPAAAPSIEAPSHDKEVVTIRFVTPLSIKTKGKLLSHAPSMDLLLTTLLRRAASLAAAHAGVTDFADHLRLKSLVRQCSLLQADVGLLSWKRRSKRQGRDIPMQGLVGRATYGPLPREIWPWLKLGELIHIGRGTAYGLGAIEVRGPRVQVSESPSHI